MRNVEIGKVYRHFKGNKYLVLDIGYDADTLQEKVIYKALQLFFVGFSRIIEDKRKTV